jgi:predicted Fe-Mo cluster-binding NifX family protein
VRIAITATGPTLDAEVDPRFGRCQYFIIVDPETMEFEALENSNAMAGGGAGISTGQMIAGKGVEVVLTGNCGPNAYQVLSAAGLQVITGVSGRIRDAIEEYKLGTFSATQQPNVADHFGMSYGGGMGRGMGRGMGIGARMMPSSSPISQPPSPEQELEALKAQSQALAQQLSEIQRHIEELEKKRR